MNKCYFGNFQDFCKYGLLRELENWHDAGGFRFHLCFGQMTTKPDRPFASDKNWGYLQTDGGIASLDKELFACLRNWREHGEQAGDLWLNISHDLLPNTEHYDDEIPESPQERGEFFRHMSDAFSGGDTVFLNPDYGLDLAARLLKAGNTGDVNSRFFNCGRNIDVYQGRKIRLVLSGGVVVPAREQQKPSARCYAASAQCGH